MARIRSKAVWGAALALWVMMPTAAATASGESGKVDRLLKEAGSFGSPQQVIIRYRSGAKDSVKAKLSRRGAASGDLAFVQAVKARLDAREIQELASDPDVLSVSADALVTTSAAKSGDSANTISELKKTLGLQNWFTGSTITVAVIDSGVQDLADFSGRIVAQYDFTNNRGGQLMTATDEYGHGTHVSGLLGSSGASSNGKYAGVAPGIRILSLKVLDKKGTGRTSAVIEAIQFAVANKHRFGIRVINLSLGHPIYESAATDPLVQAVEAASRAGIIVVAAAGNYGTNPATGLPGYGGIASPGNAPSAITVGAAKDNGTLVRTDDRVAGYSSRGPSWYDAIAKPDILAPGHNLVSNEIDGSTLALEYPSLIVTEGSSKYLKLNGSSMATGVVSGLVAVMIEANDYAAQQRWDAAQSELRRSQRTPFPGAPALTPNAIKALLQYSATPLRDANGTRYDALTQGSGMVDGLGAMVLAYYADTTKPAGTFWMTGTYAPTTNFGGVEEAWSQTVVWGTRLISGGSIVELNQAAWDDNIVWGTGELDNIVWGTVADDGENIVWGTNLDGDNIVWGTSILDDLSWSGNATFGDNIVWGTMDEWGDNIVWGTNLIGFYDGDNIVWGTMDDGSDNIVWGTLDDDNIVWGTSANKVTVLGTSIGGGL